YSALEAADRLAKEDGIETTVVNVRFLKPFDRELILSLLAGTDKIVTVEEGSACGGFASVIQRELLQGRDRGQEFLALAVGEGSLPLASRNELLAHCGLDAAGIYRSVREFVQHK
ncbi:MAG: 1-deoxy-D-xylulose-5-phosphate synthase, partial [Candidatus Aminicenantes bacterium]|nr:1-deoxy-D-xylulose-5-phosphate synthase [Candidatus Aminicenantes bacterium]